MSIKSRAGIKGFGGKSPILRNSAKSLVGLRRWDKYNPNYGGGGRRATRLLQWAPPVLTDPTTIKITNSDVSITLDTTKDYILLLPGAVGNDLQQTPHQPRINQNNGMIISGGRNIVMIGGAVRRDVDMLQGRYVTSSSLYRAARNRAFYLKDWTGRFHMEGVYIGGQHLYEAFNISSTSPTASLCLQNIYVDDTCLKSPDYTGGSTHDGGDAGVQNWDGPRAGLFVDGFTVNASTYQAFFHQPNQFGTAPPSITDERHVNIDWARPEKTGWPEAGRKLPWPWDTNKFGSGNKQLHFGSTTASAGPMSFEEFWVQPWPGFTNGQTADNPAWGVNPDPSDPSPTKPSVATDGDGFKQITWPGLTHVTGRVRVGVPPGGDWVPKDTVGIGYVSPGYVDQSGAPAPVAKPTTASTMTLGTATSSTQPVTWTSVSTATAYTLEFKRSTDTTWTTASSTSDLLATVSGLDPATSYDYRVTATNTGGSGPASTTKTGSTAAAPVAPATPSSNENPQADWVMSYFNDFAATFDLINPSAMFTRDATNERMNVQQSGTAGTYFAFLPFSTNGPSQALSVKVTGAAQSTTRHAFQLVLNLPGNSDPAPKKYYLAYYDYTSTTANAFGIRQYNADGTNVVLGSVANVTLAATLGRIMRFEHRVEANGSHTLELSYDGVPLVTVPNVASPYDGTTMAIRHFNAGGSSATVYANAHTDDIRGYGKPAA